MSPHVEMIRRFDRRHVINHLIMLVCFFGLVATGMPQKYPAETWAKAIVLLIGGVERVRVLHHLLGTAMALQLVWHALEAVWVHFVRRRAMPMVPVLDDMRNFIQQVKFNLGLEPRPPRMDRYGFAEKLEYLALVWGTVVMVATGLLLLYPVRWTVYLPGEVVLAAKAAHGGEAVLAFLSILTWHFYFVHVRHWNTSMFTGKLDAEAYADEHPLELARLRREENAKPAPVQRWRVAVFLGVSAVVIGGVVLLVAWMNGIAPSMAMFRLPARP